MAPMTANLPPFLQPTLITALLVFASVFVTSQAAFDRASVDKVLTAVQACRADTNPGLAVSVVIDGRVLLSRGYGVTRIRGNERVTRRTRFNVASLSKAFAATLMLKIMEEDGRYNLSTKVRDILGHDFRFEDEVRTREATVEDLLSHKMAVPPNNRLRFDDTLTRANLKDRMKYLKAPDAFRNLYIYSNLMYGLVTRMTEIVGGARWEDLLTRHLFQPLGMERSTFAKDVIYEDTGLAHPVKNYYGQLQPYSHHLPYYWSELAGSGAVVSTADDMGTWMQLHLATGKDAEGRQLVPRATMEELYKARTAMPHSPMNKFLRPDVPVSMSYDIYAMGWRRGYYRGYPTVGHSGSSFGYSSQLILLPTEKIGVFTTMTGSDSNFQLRGALHAYLVDSALGVEPWLNMSTLCSFPAPWHNVTKSTPPYDTSIPLLRNVSAYVGRYENPAYGRLEVREWTEGPDAGRHTDSPLTVFYGFATWDLLPLPTDASSTSSPTTSPTSSTSSSSSTPSSSNSGAKPPSDLDNPERFFGKGRNITAWVDYSPFEFLPPPEGSEVVVELRVRGFETKVPPVFTRVGWTTSGAVRVAAGVGCWLLVGLVALLSSGSG